MKVLTLNYGRVSPFEESYGEYPYVHIPIFSFRIIWDMIEIVPLNEDGTKGKEEYLTLTDGCFYYDGIFYSDIWVDDIEEARPYVRYFDSAKKVIPRLVHDLLEILKGKDNDILPDDIELVGNEDKHWIQLAINICKRCDGETMQHILEKSCQDEQMHKQLIQRKSIT